MRLAHLFVLAGAALSPVAAATPADFMTPPPATIISPPPPATAAVNESASAWFADGPSQPSQPPSASVPNCCTATQLSATTQLSNSQPNATASQVKEVTGGAIPQQMQASIVGLLGFCIVGLVML